MNISLILFFIGILGFVLNRKNIILILISIEIMLLAITFLILIASLNFDDILGQIYATYIISIAGAESAIGLGILVAFYRLKGSIAIMYLTIIILPLLASIVSGFFGRKVGISGLLMFVGWEGVGVCSYLPVSFWFTRIAANQSSISAFLTNRVGDCFLTIGMFAITFLILIASLNFDDILGKIYATYIISIAGAESAIGLGILVAFYRLRGSIAIEFK